MNNSNTFNKSDLFTLSDTAKHSFVAVYVILIIISLIGNTTAIYSICKKNYRCVQKTCIISLALSDILSTITIFTINIKIFTSGQPLWYYGEFACGFMPMCQTAGILASSIALMFIALDRYRNVVHALDKRWNPRLSFCVGTTAVMWLISFGVLEIFYIVFFATTITYTGVPTVAVCTVWTNMIGLSSPLFGLYTFVPVRVLDDTRNETISAVICVSFEKESLNRYYITMVTAIFLPLLLIFLWFYYNIACLVWKHRKPLSTIFQKGEKSRSKKTDIKVERKIRTFKIIITLMAVFIIFRLPYYIDLIARFYLEDGDYAWYLSYSFMAFNIFNCCLNPLLYTFLNVTLKMWVRIKNEVNKFVCEICCFCCSNSDFDDFENPFASNEKKNTKVKFEDQVRY